MDETWIWMMDGWMDANSGEDGKLNHVASRKKLMFAPQHNKVSP